MPKITKKHCQDSGMAATLLCLIFANLFIKIEELNFVAIGTLLVSMTIPILFKPFAFFWFGLSHIMGNVMSKVLLTIVFAVIVVPIGSLLKLFRKDLLYIKGFKKSTDSVFKDRNHKFSFKDLENQF